MKARTFEAFPKTYGIVHPGRAVGERARNPRSRRCTSRRRRSAPSSTRPSGWERPQWYEANAPLVERYGVEPREAEWDARWWSPIINAEHLAMREHAGIFDLSAFAIFDVSGAGALDALQHARAGADGRRRSAGSSTRRCSAPGGGFKSDLTIMRLGDEEFRIVTGGAHGMADRKLFVDPLPDDGSASLVDVTTAWTTIGLWGPRARDILVERHLRRRLARGLPVRHAAGRSRSARSSCSPRASRTSATSAGSSTCRSSRARGSGTSLWEAGAPHALTACGIGVYGTTGRLEKCYRAYGAELETEYNVVEAGMQRPKVKEQDFVGKEAHLRHREEEPAAILCTLTVDDHTLGERRRSATRSAASRSRSRDGTPLTDAKGRRSYVTSAGAGPSLGKYILHGLPAARARGRGLGRRSPSST